MNTERIYTVRVAMTAGICLSYITCVEHREILRPAGYGWRIVLAGVAGAVISLAVSAAGLLYGKALKPQRDSSSAFLAIRQGKEH